MITEKIYREWMVQTPEKRQNQIIKRRFFSDRVRALCVYRLLSYGLGYTPKDFKYNRYGKPFLTDDSAHFSMSHSEGCVAVAISQEIIGVDCESVRPYPVKVAKRVFTQNEQDYITLSNDPDDAFFTLWTLKESYIKALGVGMSFPLKSVEFTIGEQITCSDRSFDSFSSVVDGSRLSVCGKEPVEVISVSLGSLCE